MGEDGGGWGVGSAAMIETDSNGWEQGGALSNKGWWENVANVADNRHNNKTLYFHPLSTLHHSPIAHLCGMSSLKC